MRTNSIKTKSVENSKKYLGRKNACHIEWKFRPEALCWKNEFPVGVNIYPIATEFHNWMLQKGTFGIFTEEDKKQYNAITNPYTYHCSVLGTILSNVINESSSFAKSTDEADDFDVEVQSIRIYNELVLYTTRFCEALIKQLLYCTDFATDQYRNLSLGKLMVFNCKGCKNPDIKKPKLSLLGSLAHRYKLCNSFESCLFEHLKIVNHRRNIEAAHSDIAHFKVKSAFISREKLGKEAIELGNELVHMLQHISDLETRMIDELQRIYFSSLIDNLKASISSAKVSNPS